ncbi:creatininase family protein [Microvirga brassicacearum]|uniref:Creatininase family protein n=1 Tax=Microvirga brassicacearum TaxID=2580413 RepID=A0A5N3P5B4_9HYPH|nr:creatininase family protein [Microvirga brassicacearum]KAB0264909.1 creatininase family protein [Microvirga brassicacearum]
MPGHRWSDLSRRDFSSLDRSRAIAVVAIGATEQHGPHLPVCVDTSLVEAVLERALPLVDDGPIVLAVPPLAYGKSNEHADAAGTISLSSTTLIAVLTDIARSLARSRIKRLVLLNGHGGNTPVLDIVSRDIKIELGMQVATCHWYCFNDANSITDAREQAFGIHAGLVETSAMLALRPDLVRMEHARDFRNAAQDWQDQYRHIGLTPGRARPAWVMADLNLEGACGDAASATSEIGERLIETAARQFASFLSEFDRFCGEAEASHQDEK